jgi:hypothetical protein
MVATGSNGKPAQIRLVSIASYTTSAAQDSAKATEEADRAAFNGDASQSPLRLVSLGPNTVITGYQPDGYVVPDTETAIAQLMFVSNGDVIPDTDAVTPTAEPVEHGIDIIEFGPPRLIRPGESTKYRFHTLDDFVRAKLTFLIVNTKNEKESMVASTESLQGIMKNDWIGKDGSRHWDGKKGIEHGSEEGQPSIGGHRLQIDAWNRYEFIWQSTWSDDLVTVINGN